jgi:hypothetical protein
MQYRLEGFLNCGYQNSGQQHGEFSGAGRLIKRPAPENASCNGRTALRAWEKASLAVMV